MRQVPTRPQRSSVVAGSEVSKKFFPPNGTKNVTKVQISVLYHDERAIGITDLKSVLYPFSPLRFLREKLEVGVRKGKFSWRGFQSTVYPSNRHRNPFNVFEKL